MARAAVVLLMWIGYTARQGGLEPSVSKPLLFIGAGVTWLVLAALSGLELSSRRVDGFVVATVAALAGSYCVCWVSMAVGRTKLVLLTAIMPSDTRARRSQLHPSPAALGTAR